MSQTKRAMPGKHPVKDFFNQPRLYWIAAPRVMRSAAMASLIIFGYMHCSERFVISSAHAQSIQPQKTKSDKARAKSPMERCLATWDRATQMSKQEWRETCKRTVREFPDLYARPY